MNFTFSPKDFSIALEVKGTTWHTLEGFEPYIAYGGSAGVYGVKDISEKVLFREAGTITDEPVENGVGWGTQITLKDFPGSAAGLELELYVWQETAADVLRCELIPLAE